MTSHDMIRKMSAFPVEAKTTHASSAWKCHVAILDRRVRAHRARGSGSCIFVAMWTALIGIYDGIPSMFGPGGEVHLHIDTRSMALSMLITG